MQHQVMHCWNRETYYEKNALHSRGEYIMKIAICDDNIYDIETLKTNIRKHSSGHRIHTFLSVKPFLRRVYGGEQFDMVFLDVQMPDADGWEIALELKRRMQKLFIAMVTIHGEYIYDCFGRVDWFAPKPISKERVWIILDNADEKLFPPEISFKSGKMLVKLTAAEIIYFESQRNIIFIHTLEQEYKERSSLKQLKEKILPYHQFIQVHSSFIINMDYYDHLDRNYIILKNHEAIKLSRTFRSNFLTALAEYLRRV